MPTLAERFAVHLRRRRLFERPGLAVVAVSGGPDSLALLDLLAGVAGPHGLRLVLAHADHGIHSDSGLVATMVAQLGIRYGLPCEIGRLALGPGTTETAARLARYRWLEATRQRLDAEWLVTAHHRDDQVETVLLRALRGSGPAGLAGIATRSRTGLIRPLLPFTRAELADHLAAREITAYQDPANDDPRHLRSWLRRVVLPALDARLGPEARRNLIRVAHQAAADRSAWNAVLDQLPGLGLRVQARGFEVDRGVLTQYDAALAAAVLRAAARRVGLVIGPRRAARLVDLARRPSGRRLPLGDEWRAEVAFDRLRVEQGTAAEPDTVIPASAQRGTATFGVFTVEWRPEVVPDRVERAAWSTWLPDLDWELRAPRPGDAIAPLGGVGHRPLRRLLMEARVPRGDRPAYPVVASGETILWIPGICRSAALLPAPGTRAVRVDVTGL